MHVRLYLSILFSGFTDSIGVTGLQFCNKNVEGLRDKVLDESMINEFKVMLSKKERERMERIREGHDFE